MKTLSVTKEDLNAIVESLYKLEKKISAVNLTLKLETETHVPDLMTRIRILPGVAVVAQKDKVARFFDGDAQLKIGIKFLPDTDEIINAIKSLGKLIKSLPGVTAVVVHEYNKRKITVSGKRIVL